ncbi:MAG: right-handed parallel beta-helix repeat-containing protein [Terriglobales bacterium]
MLRFAKPFLACLILASAAWPARDPASVNVRRFGAGSGRDDTQAIQRALNYACSLPQGRELYFPPGTYNTKSTVEIPCGYITLSSNAAAWNFEGSGPALVIRRPAVLVRLVNLKIRGISARGGFGLQILGTKLPGSEGPVGVTKLIVDACEFTGFGDAEGGAAIDIESDTPGGSIRDCVFNNPGTAINVNGPTDTLIIHDNYIVSSAGWGVKIANGLGAGAVHIEHNNFTTAGGAIRLERAGMVTIRGNEYETYHFAKAAHSAPFDLISAQRILFEDNTVNPHDGSDYCVWVGDAVTDSVFEKNALSNCGQSGFRLGSGARNSYRLNTGANIGPDISGAKDRG